MIPLRISLFVATLLVLISLSEVQPFRPIRQLPTFGRSMRQEFLLNPQLIYLNHGSSGAYPKAVQKAMRDYQDRAEANPDQWSRTERRAELDKVREGVAKIVKASADDIVMIINTSSGVNAIFRSMVFGVGERILQFTTTYGSMKSIIKYTCDYSAEKAVTALTFNLIYPISQERIVEDLTAFLDTNHDPVRPIRIALIDHIVSAPGAVLPIEKIIPLLKARNITVAVDGAHALGQIPINITDLQPDYYITTCYKWFFAPKGCAVMYVNKKHQSTIHPASIASMYAQPASYQNEFYTTGTIDYSPYLAVAAAIQFREEVGGEEAIMSYTHRLAVDGGTYLANIFGTEILQDSDQIANMVDVLLPVDNHDDPAITRDLWNDSLATRFSNPITARVHMHAGRWYVRASAQIYTDLGDFEVLGAALNTICNEINGNNLSGTSLTGGTATALAVYGVYGFISDNIF